jgi:ribosomal protein S20
MEGFKPFKKVQCFKEGGSVQKEVHNFTKRDRKNVEPGDLAQDKAIVKKAFSQHDKAKHGGSEATEIKLKKGGRAKKECGTVKKYKTGGKVENAYGAKKTDKDIKDIANSKRQKPALLCGGKSVRKMAAGGQPDFQTDPAAAQAALDTQDNVATRNMIMNPARRAKKYLMDKLSGLSPMNAAVSNIGTPAPMPGAMSDKDAAIMGRKKGGKVKKMNTGGTCS